jgi:hypothetical protein
MSNDLIVRMKSDADETMKRTVIASETTAVLIALTIGPNSVACCLRC